MQPPDPHLHRLLAEERRHQLVADSEPVSPGPIRRRVGGWLVAAGLRLSAGAATGTFRSSSKRRGATVAGWRAEG